MRALGTCLLCYSRLHYWSVSALLITVTEPQIAVSSTNLSTWSISAVSSHLNFIAHFQYSNSSQLRTPSYLFIYSICLQNSNIVSIMGCRDFVSCFTDNRRLRIFFSLQIINASRFWNQFPLSAAFSRSEIIVWGKVVTWAPATLTWRIEGPRRDEARWLRLRDNQDPGVLNLQRRPPLQSRPSSSPVLPCT